MEAHVRTNVTSDGSSGSVTPTSTAHSVPVPVPDHSYLVRDSPRSVKHKLDAVVHHAAQVRKRLKYNDAKCSVWSVRLSRCRWIPKEELVISHSTDCEWVFGVLRTVSGCGCLCENLWSRQHCSQTLMTVSTSHSSPTHCKSWSFLVLVCTRFEDRIALGVVCKQASVHDNLSEKASWSTRQQTLVSRLKAKFDNKQLKPSYSKTMTRNKNAKKMRRSLELGWLNFDYQVRENTSKYGTGEVVVQEKYI